MQTTFLIRLRPDQHPIQQNQAIQPYVYLNASKYVSRKMSQQSSRKILDENYQQFMTDKLCEKQQQVENIRVRTKLKYINSSMDDPQYLKKNDQFRKEMSNNSLHISSCCDLIQNQNDRQYKILLEKSSEKYSKLWNTKYPKNENVQKRPNVISQVIQQKDNNGAPIARICAYSLHEKPKFLQEHSIPKEFHKDYPAMAFLLKMTPSKRPPMDQLRKSLVQTISRIKQRQELVNKQILKQQKNRLKMV